MHNISLFVAMYDEVIVKDISPTEGTWSSLVETAVVTKLISDMRINASGEDMLYWTR